MKALYSVMVLASLLVGCGGGEGYGHAGTYAMTVKMQGEEKQLRFELKSDNTFTAVPYVNGEKMDESVSGTWKVEGDDIVSTGKDDKDGEEVGFKFNKDTLKLTAMTEDGKDRLDKFKAQFG